MGLLLLATVAVGLSVWRDRLTAIADGNREARNIATVLGQYFLKT